MGANRINKIDEIQNNTTTNITLSPSADIIANSPNITANKVLFVDTSKELKTSAIDQSNITKNSLNETTDPAASNDDSQDYSVGSFWYNKTYGKLFVCTDASTAAAVWNLVREVIIDTKTNIDGLSRQAGNLYYASDEQLYYGDDGTQLISLGGGGVTSDTLANIQGATREAGKLYFATDTDDFLGDDGTNLQSLGIIKDTKANLDSLTRLAGRIVYATDLNSYFGDDGTNLISLGGSIGSIDTYFAENYEVNDVSSLTSGNNATYLTAGTFQGTLANETTNEIQGTRSISYTQAVGSLNDWFNIETITLDEQQKDKTNTFVFYANYSGNTGDIEAVVWDGSAKIATVDIEAATVAKRYELKPFVASSVTNLSIGFQVKVANSGAELIFDSVELNTNPFQFTNLTEDQFIHYSEYSAQASTNTAIPYFVTAQANTGANILTVANDSTNGFSVTANRRCRVNMNYFVDSSGTSVLGISKNSSQLTTNITSINQSDRVAYSSTGSTAGGNASCEVVLEAGDVLRPHAEAAPGFNDNTRHGVVITAKAEVESLVSNLKDGANWNDYTPSTQGFGSVSSVNFRWKRQGDSVKVVGYLTCGTVSANEAQIGLPNSIAVDTNVDALSIIGTCWRGTTASNDNYSCLATAGDTFVNIGYQTTGTNAIGAAQLGNTLFASSDVIYVNFEVPIEGWSLENSVTVVSPLLRACRIYDQKSDGTAGGTGTANAWTARDLNQLDGDTSFVSLSSNQFTLASGEYIIQATAPFRGSDSASLRLYNTTDAALESNILSGQVSTGANTNTVEVSLKGRFVIDSPKTFELQYLINQSVSGNDLGSARVGTVSEVEIYADMLLMKIR